MLHSLLLMSGDKCQQCSDKDDQILDLEDQIANKDDDIKTLEQQVIDAEEETDRAETAAKDAIEAVDVALDFLGDVKSNLEDAREKLRQYG